ncbi:MAG: hypothetical protein AUI14_04915 [Actinobacteria bacterium 13_2_20CM_2_71_6]|nr:MAG: hypothetical protein AUI14_04915 [Actinobacteria bacterium 13_2_20CM_2_71_6]
MTGGFSGDTAAVNPIAEIFDFAGQVTGQPPTRVEIQLAVRAVCVHAAESWQHGMFCANCHVRFPCRLHRWGCRVLAAAGWSEETVAAVCADFRRTGCPPWELPPTESGTA